MLILSMLSRCMYLSSFRRLPSSFIGCSHTRSKGEKMGSTTQNTYILFIVRYLVDGDDDIIVIAVARLPQFRNIQCCKAHGVHPTIWGQTASSPECTQWWPNFGSSISARQRWYLKSWEWSSSVSWSSQVSVLGVVGCRYDFSPTPLLSSNTMQLTLCCPSIRKQQQQQLSVCLFVILSSLDARVMLVSGDFIGLLDSSHGPPNQPRTRPARPPKLQARTFSLKLTTLQLYYYMYVCILLY